MSGAGDGCGLPLDVFADLHEKNSRIFACENRSILTQKRKASMFVPSASGSPSDFFYEPIFFNCFIYDNGSMHQ